MPSTTYGIAMLALASLNIIISLVGVIYANVGMSSWNPAKFEDLVKTCVVETTPEPGEIKPFACYEVDLDCGDTKCFPGEYCVEEEDNANGVKAGTCERCTNSKRLQKNTFPGASRIFDFKGKNWDGVGPLNNAERCLPFVRYSVGGTVQFYNKDQAYQQHGGTYMCSQPDECSYDGCTEREDAFAEARRLNTLICPKSNPFPIGLPNANSEEVVAQGGGQSTLSLSYTPTLVGAVMTIVAAIVIAIGGIMVMTQNDLADTFVKVAFAACAIAVVVSLGCTIATGVGAQSIMAGDISGNVITRAAKAIPLDPRFSGAKGQGDLQGGCPKSCRLVKGAVGNYLEAFAGFAYINLGLLVTQLLLNAAAMMCVMMACCCSQGDGDENNSKRQKVQAVYKAPAANKKQKKAEPAVTYQPKNDRRKSMATRAVPTAPNNKGMATRAVPTAPNNKGGAGFKEAGEILVAVYDFKGDGAEELVFFEGDKIELMEEFSDGWAQGRLCDDTRGTGLFPLNYTMGKGGRV